LSYITYAIIDPRDNVPVYVGQSKNFRFRKQTHLNYARKGKTPKTKGMNIRKYLFELNSIGFLPKFLVLEKCLKESESLRSEFRWIKTYVNQGFPLLNNWIEHKEIFKDTFGVLYKEYFKNRLSVQNIEQLKNINPHAQPCKIQPNKADYVSSL
jgi:hypothetical protein